MKQGIDDGSDCVRPFRSRLFAEGTGLKALCFVRAGFQPGEGVGDGGAVEWEGGSLEESRWRCGGGRIASDRQGRRDNFCGAVIKSRIFVKRIAGPHRSP